MTALELFSTLIFSFFSVWISIKDGKTRLIPRFPLYTGIILLLIFYISAFFLKYLSTIDFLLYAAGAILSPLLFFTVRLINKDKLGMGDVKYSLFCGLYSGIPSAFIGFVSATLICLLYTLIRKKKRSEKIPFGPFMFAGSLLAILVKNLLIRYYIE